MTRLCIFAMSTALVAATVSAINAQDGGTETSQFVGSTINLYKDKASPVYKIWNDVFERELSTRDRLSQMTKRPVNPNVSVFTASFDTENRDNRIIVAATATPDKDCQSYSNVGLSGNLLSCPLRVALVRGNDVTVIDSEPSFTFSVGVNEDGEFDNKSESNRTLLMFDKRQKTISSHVQVKAVGAQVVEPGADDAVLRLKY